MVADVNADVVVVGGGIIGLATAWELKRRGATVTVVERDGLGRGASWSGGGLLSPLPPGICPDSLRPLLDDSLKRYPGWCTELAERSGIDPEYWQCGGRYLREQGDELLPDLAQVRNPRLLKALIAALRHAGVRLLEGHEVIGWQRTGDRLVGVRTAQTTIPCAQALLAAGAWSKTLGAADIRPVKGQMLLFRLPAGAVAEVRISDEGYVIPRRDGYMLVGSTLEHAGYDLTPTDAARLQLTRLARSLAPELNDHNAIRHWAGLRPHIAADTPRLAEDEHTRGLFHASGHYRLGITLAPASAVTVATLMLE